MTKPSNDDDAFPTDQSLLDRLHAAGSAAASAADLFFPGLSVAGQLLWTGVTPPITRRQHAWFNRVGERLRELEAAGFLTAETLATSPEAFDVFVAATRAATATSEEEKLQALRNAVVNTVLPDAPEAAVRLLFVRLLDQFTPWHMRVLRLLNDPMGWAAANGFAFGQNKPRDDTREWIRLDLDHVAAIIARAFPALSESGLLPVVVKDLADSQLLTRDDGTGSTGGVEWSQKGMRLVFASRFHSDQREVLLDSMLSPLGLRFLAFIDDRHDVGGPR